MRPWGRSIQEVELLVVGGTEGEIFALPLEGLAGAGGGCWAGTESGLRGVSGRSPGRRCCGCSGVRVARVCVAVVVVASRRTDTSVMSGSSATGSGVSKVTG